MCDVLARSSSVKVISANSVKSFMVFTSIVQPEVNIHNPRSAALTFKQFRVQPLGCVCAHKKQAEAWTLNRLSGIHIARPSKMPRLSRIAAGTNGKVITAERALAIMTGHATQRPSRRMMIERLGCSHLSPLWHSRAHLMTFVAVNLLMFCMTKTHAKRLREFGRSGVAT